MLRVCLRTDAIFRHFVVMYAIAVVEIQLEVVSIATLLFFVMPLSLTLTTFLLWIMYGLQGWRTLD